jgi:anti-anti-sigma factor
MNEGILTVKTRKVGKVDLMDLNGRLIMGRPVEDLKTYGNSLIESGATVLGVNLAKISYMDSSGMGALATLWTSAKRAGALCRFYAAPPRVATLLKITRLDTAMEFLPDEDAVLASS